MSEPQVRPVMGECEITCFLVELKNIRNIANMPRPVSPRQYEGDDYSIMVHYHDYLMEIRKLRTQTDALVSALEKIFETSSDPRTNARVLVMDIREIATNALAEWRKKENE